MFNTTKILNGELFLISTDTVAGIGGILTEQTKKSICIIKKNNTPKKFAILVADLEQAREFDEWNKSAEQYAKKYWPGALTIALNTYGIRMPNSPKILKLLKKIGPIYLSSANIHNNPPLEFHEAKIKFKDEIKIHLNYNKNSSGLSSTIINAKTNKILRQGSVKII